MITYYYKNRFTGGIIKSNKKPIFIGLSPMEPDREGKWEHPDKMDYLYLRYEETFGKRKQLKEEVIC